MITAEVYMWGTRIGVVAQPELHSMPIFNYDKKFLKSGIQVSPLVMPLSNVNYSFPYLAERTFHNLPGLLADSLPDKFGTLLLERYLTDQGRNLNSLSAVERLLYTGKRGMGALEYVPAKDYASNYDADIDINALVKLASDILMKRKEIHIDSKINMMEQIINIGTSAGGARAKAIIAWNPHTKEIRSGQIDAGNGFEYWLLKFDGVENNKDKGPNADDPAYTRIEYAYYLMAKSAKIEMSQCRLYEENGKYHFMTKRFDRLNNGEKLHMQTLGALAHFDYNQPGAHSYEQAADVINKLNLGINTVEELYKRMVFNILARNQDDHVKNISFLMDKKGQWYLAPAYDITYANDPSNIWLSKHQMTMNGKADNFVLKDFYEAGKVMNLKKSKIDYIIENVRDALSKWNLYAEKAKLPEKIVLYTKNQFIII